MMVDKESITLYLGMTKDDQVHMLEPVQIQRINIEPCKVFSWYRIVASEKISIFISQNSPPFVFVKQKHKQYYDEYKTKIKEFAERHYLTIRDTTAA